MVKSWISELNGNKMKWIKVMILNWWFVWTDWKRFGWRKTFLNIFLFRFSFLCCSFIGRMPRDLQTRRRRRRRWRRRWWWRQLFEKLIFMEDSSLFWLLFEVILEFGSTFCLSGSFGIFWDLLGSSAELATFVEGFKAFGILWDLSGFFIEGVTGSWGFLAILSGSFGIV